MNLREFLDMTRLYWKTFAATCIVVLALGITWLVLSPLQYVSTAQLLVTLNGTTTANAYQNDDVVAGRVNSYVALLTSEVVSQRVVDKLGLKMSADQLGAKISAVQVPPNTAIIDIAATDPSAEQAQRIANTVAEEFVAYTQALESPTGVDAQKVQTQVVSAASAPRSRLAERIGISAMIGLLSLFAGAVAVWVRAATDPVIRTPRQAVDAAEVPVLAVVRPGAAESLEDLEPYRRVRAALKREGCRVVQISPIDDTIDAVGIATNLGRAMALGGSRCVVVDATGDEHSDTDAVNAGRGAGPDLLTVGAWAAAPGLEPFTGVASGIGELKGAYQRVVVATPPLSSGASASILSEYADGIVLSIALGGSRRIAVHRAVEKLAGIEGGLHGVLALR